MKRLFAVLFLLFSTHSRSYSTLFHAYRQNFQLSEVSTSCKNNFQYFEKPQFIDVQNQYGLWPNLISQYQMKTGETLFGFNQAMETIWKHQHPLDCKTAKFMVSTGYPSGFGSEIHVEGLGLTHALNSGRVYLQHPGGPEKLRAHMKWQTDNSHCRAQKTNTLECYFLPWSNCTLADAFEESNPTGKGLPSYDLQNPSAASNNRTIFFVNRDSDVPIIPQVFEELASCSPFNETHNLYWWRAIMASYILRPNSPTLLALETLGQSIPVHQPTHKNALQVNSSIQTQVTIEKFTSSPIKTSLSSSSSYSSSSYSEPGDGTRWVGVYVRHGDKHVEMALQPFSKYAETIEQMMTEGRIQNLRDLDPTDNSTQNENERSDSMRAIHSSSFRNLFIGSEDPQVLSEADDWGKKNGWTVKHTSLFDRTSVSAHLPHSNQLHLKSSNSAQHHDLEYLSMLLNLQLALRCDAWVCTHPSNWCRLIDELRATVGGKANYVYADISPETCREVPCMDGTQMKAFDYR